MAITESSMQSLGVLQQLLQQAYTGREAEKDRAFRMMGMKVQSDERELDRLNRLAQIKMQEKVALEQEILKTTGTLRALEKLGKETGVSGTDAKAVISQQRSVIASDVSSKRDEINELNSQIKQRKQEQALFYKGIKLGPEIYGKYAEADKAKGIRAKTEVSPEEWEMALAEYKNLTPQEEAGVKTYLNQKAAGEFGEAYKERYLDLMEQRLGLDRMRLSLSAQAMQTDIRPEAEEWNQYRDMIAAAGKQYGITDDFALALPQALSNPRTLKGAMDALAIQTARMAEKFSDRHAGIIPWLGSATKEFKEKLDRFTELDKKGDPQAQVAAYDVARYLRMQPNLKELEGDDERAFMAQFLHGFNILHRGQSKLGLDDIGPYLGMGLAVDELSNLDGEVPVGEDTGFGGMWDKLWTIPEGVEKPTGPVGPKGKKLLKDLSDFLFRGQ